MGILERFKRKLYEVCGDDFYTLLDEDMRKHAEESSENHRIAEEIISLLKGKRADRADIILREVCFKIKEKQSKMII